MNILTGILVLFLALIGYCGWRIRAQGLSRATAKRWFLYIPIALLLISVFSGFYVYADYRGISDELAVKWMNIFTTALFVFGYAVKRYWQYRKRWTFWAELCVLLFAHFAILQRLQWQKGGYFWLLLVVGIPEMFVVFLLLNLMFDSKSDSPSGSLPL
jgi:hypothetical protein